MRPVEVVRTYLELRDPGDLHGGTIDDPALSLAPEVRCSVETYRELYDLVGREYHWRDRMSWSDERLAAHLGDPSVVVWVLRHEGRPAGYFELVRGSDGSVEISYFGLAGEFIGRGFGKHLLTRAVEESWRMGATRVWLHTCTLDGPAALPNYRARGFTEYRIERYVTEIP